MNISINCNISLSKKLRALLGKQGSITLVVQDLVEGKGHGILTLDSDTLAQTAIDTTETSIMLTPVELAYEAPSSDSIPHASIFTTSLKNQENNPVINRIAVIKAPDKGQEHKAVKKNIETPKAFKELDIPACKEWIDNMEELIQAVKVAQTKTSTIDPSLANNKREQAIMMEAKEKAEGIDVPAWVVNDKYGMLTVNDLNISLPMNVPYDLSNVSAKRIASSKELKNLLKSGTVRFVSPQERDSLIENTIEEAERTPGLQVYDNAEQAEAAIASKHYSDDDEGETKIHDINTPRRPTIKASKPAKQQISDDSVEYTEEELAEPTEEESMIVNLTQNMPTKKIPRPIEVERTTTHTNYSEEKSNKPNIRPIRKLE